MDSNLLRTFIEKGWIKEQELTPAQKVELWVQRPNSNDRNVLVNLGCKQAVIDALGSDDLHFPHHFKNIISNSLVEELIEHRIANKMKDLGNQTLLEVVYSQHNGYFMKLWEKCHWPEEAKMNCLIRILSRHDANPTYTTDLLGALIQKGLLKPEDFKQENHELLFINAKSKKAIELLKNAGFNINAKGKDGYTALAHNVLLVLQNPAQTEFLLKAGADPKVTVSWGGQKTPLEIAQSSRGASSDVIKVLKHYTQQLTQTSSDEKDDGKSISLTVRSRPGQRQTDAFQPFADEDDDKSSSTSTSSSTSSSTRSA